MTNESPVGSVTEAGKHIPATANSGSIATMGLDLQEGPGHPRKQAVSWALRG